MRLAWSSLFLLAACGDDSGLPDARMPDAPPPGGTLSLTWSIADGATTLTCAQVNASVVSVTLVPDDAVFGTTDAFTCANGSGTSRAVPPGAYDVTVTLGGVDTEDVTYSDVEITAGQDTSIGDAAFEVAAIGGFSFQIVAGGQGNCTSMDMGGAGITGMQIELQRVGGGCVPVTFDIAAGATQPASTYTTDCTTPAPTGCIAHDQVVTVAPTVTTGPYRMTITGFVGADTCWSRMSQFDVPAAGESESLPDQSLTLNAQIPACDPP